MSITLLIDTREQNPWSPPMDVEAKTVTLAQGDYTAEGLEDKLIIERKASTAELCTNLGKHFDRFEREIEKMAAFEHKYLIMEFSLSTLLSFPNGSGIPKKMRGSIRMNAKFMLSRLRYLQQKYGIRIIYAGTRRNAIDKAIEIIKNVSNQEV